MVPIIWAGGAFISYMSHEIALTAISDTSSNIYGIITRLNGYSNKYIKNTLDELDIISKLEIVEALLKQIPEDKYKKETAIYIAFHHLHNIVEEIELQLGEIEIILQQHKEKWFSTWRGCEINVDKIKTNYIKLDKRLEMFIKLINLSL